LLAGPGAISTAIIAAEGGSAVHQLVIVLCIGVVCLVSWLTMRAAHRIAARMGTTGLNVATRILGLLLAAMAVQTMAVGLRQLFPGLG
jgi:multiple antibiotic resistance protein